MVILGAKFSGSQFVVGLVLDTVSGKRSALCFCCGLFIAIEPIVFVPSGLCSRGYVGVFDDQHITARDGAVD